MKSNAKRPARKSPRAPSRSKNATRAKAKPWHEVASVRVQPAPVMVDPGEKTLSAQLARLETAQLIRRAIDVEAAFLFKHILTQEAAYETLLHQQRR
jgi:hypothetical protein